MKKYILLVFLSILFSCEKSSDTLYLSGNVNGLKRGVLYLKRYENNQWITLDSVTAKGNGKFSFTQKLHSPEVLYLFLEKDDSNKNNDRLEFFALPGKMYIDTQVQLFDVNAKIEGSSAQKDFEAYNKAIQRFNYEGLTLLQDRINALKENNTKAIDSLNALTEKKNLRKLLYTVNYALTHKDSYITPYVVLRDAYQTNVKYLDSIYQSLSQEVANSKYGKELKNYIDEIKQDKPKP